MSAIDDVMKYIATNEIRWVDLQFFDVKGTMHRLSLSNRKLEESSFGNGIHCADMSSVFGHLNQGDVILLPDPDTLARLPWEPATVRLICDLVVSGKKERFLKDSRYVSERMETNMEAAGIKTALVGSEIDCFMFDTATADKTTRGRGTGVIVDSREARWGPSPLSNEVSGAYASTPYDSMYSARIQISETMEDSFGMMVDSHRHGRAPTAQQTFELAPRNLKASGDAVNTLKFITKNLAAAVNASATFAPYPVEGEHSNSLDIAISLWKTSDQNIFYDGKEEYSQLSQSGRYFIGGLLEHAASLLLFAAPTPMSYRRIAFEGVKFGWSASDRSGIVYVPVGRKNAKETKRIVYKCADPAANPYLINALVAAAGLDGIKKKVDPGDPLEQGDSKKKRVERSLPQSLHEAAVALESDTAFIKGILPSELLGDYLDLKMKQHRDSLVSLSGSELSRFYNV